MSILWKYILQFTCRMRVKIIFLLLFALNAFVIFGQDSISYYKHALELNTEPAKRAQISIKFARLLYKHGEYTQSLNLLKSVLLLTHSLHDSIAEGEAYILKGKVSSWAMKNDQALKSFLRAEEIFVHDEYHLLEILEDKGLMYDINKDQAHAMEIFRMVARKASRIAAPRIEADAWGRMGDFFFNDGNLDSAEICFEKSVSINERISSNEALVTGYMYLGKTYTQQGFPEKGKDYLEKALSLAYKVETKRSVPTIYYYLAETELKLKNTAHALTHLNKAIELTTLRYNPYLLTYLYNLKYKADSGLGNTKEAMHDLQHYIFLDDSLQSKALYNQMAEMQTRFNVEKKDNLISLLEKDKTLKDERLKRQQVVTGFVTGGLLLLSSFSVLLYRNFRAKKKAFALLEIQSKKIEDSIIYAKRIQEAILPDCLFLPDEVSDNFVFYLPKDVVSGDFYWRYRSGSHLFFAIVDCTGHGVPGAMMSMLSYDLLEHALKEKQMTEPGQILTEVNHKIIETLYQTNPDGAKDGMDIILCRLNLDSKELCFAGAKNGMIRISGTELEVFKTNKHSVGYQMEEEYVQQSVQLYKNDILYLYTDGFADQKGGPENKKFQGPQFRHLLHEISGLPCAEQHEKLMIEFLSWKANSTQRDDILIACLKC